MNRKSSIAAAALILALAALIATPALTGDTGAATEAEPTESAAAAPAARGFLGVGLRNLTPELQTYFGAPEGSGVLVATVENDSPAAAAGIRVGDVITEVDGLSVGSQRALSREVRHRPGASVAIEIYRDGEPQRLAATLGSRQARSWSAAAAGGRTPEEWAEFGERWERWAEEFGERWGEEFGERWGEEFGERWGEEHAESWERWAEEMAERGEGWEEMGEEIGKTVARALSEIDWDQIGRSVEQSMEALESVDWESLGEDLEHRMEELERHLDEQREPGTDSE